MTMTLEERTFSDLHNEAFGAKPPETKLSGDEVIMLYNAKREWLASLEGQMWVSRASGGNNWGGSGVMVAYKGDVQAAVRVKTETGFEGYIKILNVDRLEDARQVVSFIGDDGSSN